jgi:hypothetical protein
MSAIGPKQTFLFAKAGMTFVSRKVRLSPEAAIAGYFL